MTKIIKMHGGLGNQMFQYAFGKALQKKGAEVLLDSSMYKVYKVHSYELPKVFSLDLCEASAQDIRIYKGLSLYALGREWSLQTICKIFGLNLSDPSDYYREKKTCYDPEAVNNRFVYYQGYFQSYKYFSCIEQDIRDIFSFPPLEEEDKSWEKKIKSTNSVALHVRRGNYVGNKLHDEVVGLEYYRKAVDCVKNAVSNPTFFVFSDDLEWCRQNLNLSSSECEFVSGHKNKHSYVDMQLMSLCDNHIIANSSFSWWGAWLSDREGLVVAPSRWVNSELDVVDIVPSHWMRI